MIEKQKIIKYILIILTVVFAFLSWFSIDRAINIPAASNWGMPILYFSLFLICFYLSCVLIKKMGAVFLLALSSLFSSSFFVLDWNSVFYHDGAIILGLLFTVLGVSRIRRDLGLNVKINIWKTLRTGGFFIVLSLSIIIASQYYWEIEKTGVETLPEFKIGALSDDLTSKIISAINPNFKNIQNDEVTVDQFLLEINKSQLENFGSSLVSKQSNQFIDLDSGQAISNEEKELLEKEFAQKIVEANNSALETSQQLALQEGRHQLSDMAGETLKGDEKMSDVFSKIINNKINNSIVPKFSSNDNHSNISTLHLILALVLFLSVLSIGLFLNSFLIILDNFIFFIFKKIGLIVISKVQREAEIIG